MTKLEFRLVAFGLPVLMIVAVTYLVRSASFFGFTGSGGGKSSPILVQGGSMTAFTTGSWAQIGSAYCVNVDTSYIAFKNEGETKYSGSWSNFTTYPTPITQWEVDVYAQTPDTPNNGSHSSTPDRKNGWKFVSQNKGCKTASGTSVLVSSIVDGANNFYASPSLPASGNHTGNLRFLNQQSHCQGVNSASNNDEEFCERMAEVDIKLNIDTSPIAIPALPCKDGDCSLRIGLDQ